MRTKHVLLAAALLCAVVPSPALFAQGDQKKTTPTARAVNYNELYQSAIADFKAGRNSEADQKFRQVLMKYPQHIQSQRHRALIKKRAREEAAIPIMKKRLRTVDIEDVSFEDATLAEVMEYVNKKVKEATKGKLTPGLVIKGGDAVRDRPLNLKLGTVPASTLIDTTAKLTNTRVDYGTYALTFTPLPTSGELETIAAKKLEEAEAKERARSAREAESDDPFRNR